MGFLDDFCFAILIAVEGTPLDFILFVFGAAGGVDSLRAFLFLFFSP